MTTSERPQIRTEIHRHKVAKFKFFVAGLAMGSRATGSADDNRRKRKLRPAPAEIELNVERNVQFAHAGLDSWPDDPE